MLDALLDFAHSEVVAYMGMVLILSAFFMETQDILHSKAAPYLGLMALGSGLLAIRAYLIDEWAFFILEVAWFAAAVLGMWSLWSTLRASNL
ncbi:MAG: hypothetical protein QGI73_04880 [Candidatus Thalassarchaeaceae archaeon]|jgi:hypothetical protein|nr:hypothetical protein [Candidatus Thalassarchaeaceae archaeon]